MTRKGTKFQYEHYTRSEIESLLRVAEGSSPSATRNRAIIVLLWQSGLRMNEALDLQPIDVDISESKIPKIFVRHGKGDKPRHVSAGEELVTPLRAWNAVRAELEIPPKSPLFCTLSGKKLSDRYFRAVLVRLAKRAGWEKRAHPHGFRHTFAVSLAKNNVPLPIIQRQLGHSSIVTTQRYLQSLTSVDTDDAMSRVRW